MLESSPTETRPILSETASGVALQRADLKFTMSRDGATCRLYDLSNDPSEFEDLSDAEPALCDMLRAELREIVRSYEAAGRLSCAPSVPLAEDWKKKLERKPSVLIREHRLFPDLLLEPAPVDRE